MMSGTCFAGRPASAADVLGFTSLHFTSYMHTCLRLIGLNVIIFSAFAESDIYERLLDGVRRPGSLSP